MGLFDRLKSGLGRSSKAISDGLGKLFTGGKLDAAQIQSLEEILLTADIGLDATDHILAQLNAAGLDRLTDALQLKRALAHEITQILAPVAHPLQIDPSHKPAIILMAGVNGAGKTTTIAKLAEKLTQQNKAVMLVAGDTFRAAAIEQLQVWGERTGVPVIANQAGGDAAGLVYAAIEQARAQAVDVLIIDTAGRLQSNDALMAELEKIVRVMRKLDVAAPHASLLVLDATVGQNALSQAEAFQKAAATTGLIMTKLDGTARGGVLVALARKLKLPIHYIGVGEGIEDLQGFDPQAFAHALVGLNLNGEE
jgi:fused signal recognition particle receptor